MGYSRLKKGSSYKYAIWLFGIDLVCHNLLLHFREEAGKKKFRSTVSEPIVIFFKEKFLYFNLMILEIMLAVWFSETNETLRWQMVCRLSRDKGCVTVLGIKHKWPGTLCLAEFFGLGEFFFRFFFTA